MSKSVRLHSALLVVAILFSLNYILGKIVLRHFTPLAFAWVRVALSAIALHLWCRFRLSSLPRLPTSQRRALWIYAVLGVVINQLLFLTGLSLTTAHEAAILITTIPVFTLGAAVVLGREMLTRRKTVGIGLALAGALTVVGLGQLSGNRAALIGDLLILLNCLSFSLYLVLSKSVASIVEPERVVSFMFSAGALLMFPFAFNALRRTVWTLIPAEGWLALIAVVAGPTVVAYLLNAWALGQADSSTVAVYAYLQPFLATILATLLLGEVITGSDLAGAVLIFAGVYVVSSTAGSRTESSVRQDASRS